MPVSGATDGQLTIDGTRTLNTNALYQVVITNAYGSITSSVAGLTLYVAAITGIDVYKRQAVAEAIGQSGLYR